MVLIDGLTLLEREGLAGEEVGGKGLGLGGDGWCWRVWSENPRRSWLCLLGKGPPGCVPRVEISDSGQHGSGLRGLAGLNSDG